MVLLGTYPKWINLVAKAYPIIWDKIMFPKENMKKVFSINTHINTRNNTEKKTTNAEPEYNKKAIKPGVITIFTFAFSSSEYLKLLKKWLI